ncbi:thioredoxin family protein [Pelagibacterium sediminicola]|uniref:thioredoxin family protein n=1 Tax=Pelagibacterium sediminicola TaxID=2248761 RepID=UPI000E31688B|nr:co-chaperone YbbN [Pelagibacterium sediminicola]
MDLRAAQTATPANDLIRDSDTARFQADVLEASMQRPVLVDFWAPWCGPCRQLTPTLEKIVAANGGKIALVKINVDENQALAGQMGVQSIPAVFAFLGGRPVDAFMGAQPESEVARFAAKLIEAAAQAGIGGPSDNESQIAQAIQAADNALAEQDFERAYQIYSAILRQAPDNIEAIAGVAGVQFETGDIDDAEQTLGMLPEDAASPAIDGLRKSIALAREAASLGDPAALSARLQTAPDDHQARFDLAMILNARGEKLEAAQALIEIMGRDREWSEDGARRKLLELFEAWGPKDPATLKGRRLLSSLLFR